MTRGFSYTDTGITRRVVARSARSTRVLSSHGGNNSLPRFTFHRQTKDEIIDICLSSMPRGKRSVKRSDVISNEPDTQCHYVKSKKWNVGYVPLIPEFCREPGCECHVQDDSSQKLNQGHLTPSTTTGGTRRLKERQWSSNLLDN